ncbi:MULTISPECIES: hypothetical protein [Streptomyces]|uniref:hypothetical protein n=1 Tax=Streptomyces TaxID=1883 RepID=UPI001C2FC3FF|nr:hypothetical protein [Streptomyces sp. GbtcB7]
MALGTTAAPAPRPADPGRAADPGGPRTRSAVRHGRAALENLRPKAAHAGIKSSQTTTTTKNRHGSTTTTTTTETITKNNKFRHHHDNGDKNLVLIPQ